MALGKDIEAKIEPMRAIKDAPELGSYFHNPLKQGV